MGQYAGGGGALAETRVELLDEAGKVFFLINGTNAEELSRSSSICEIARTS